MAGRFTTQSGPRLTPSTATADPSGRWAVIVRVTARATMAMFAVGVWVESVTVRLVLPVPQPTSDEPIVQVPFSSPLSPSNRYTPDPSVVVLRLSGGDAGSVLVAMTGAFGAPLVPSATVPETATLPSTVIGLS